MSETWKKRVKNVLMVGIVAALAVGTFYGYKFYERESVKVYTFEPELEQFLKGEYASEKEKEKVYDATVGKAFDQFLEKNVERDYWQQAKFYVNVFQFQDLMRTEMNFKTIKAFELKKRIQETIVKCQKVYPIKDVKVVLLPKNGGLEGRTVPKNLIILYPLIIGPKENAQNEVENAIYHEYMHLIAMDVQVKQGKGLYDEGSLLSQMIEEGRAVVFAKQQMKGYRASLTVGIGASKPWEFYRPLLSKSLSEIGNHYDNPDRSRNFSSLDYYYYGERLIEAYLRDPSVKASDRWWEKGDDELITYLTKHGQDKQFDPATLHL